MAKAAGQIDMAAKNLPLIIWRRLVGTSSRPSSVARSRSPLMLSAAISRLMNRLTLMLICKIMKIISRGGISLSSLLVASKKEVMPSSKLNRIRKVMARPPRHRSLSSLLATSRQPEIDLPVVLSVMRLPPRSVGRRRLVNGRFPPQNAKQECPQRSGCLADG